MCLLWGIGWALLELCCHFRQNCGNLSYQNFATCKCTQPEVWNSPIPNGKFPYSSPQDHHMWFSLAKCTNRSQQLQSLWQSLHIYQRLNHSVTNKQDIDFFTVSDFQQQVDSLDEQLKDKYTEINMLASYKVSKPQIFCVVLLT